MKDVQSQCDGFPKVKLPWVGVEQVRFPVWVYYPHQGEFLSVVGEINAYCSLSDSQKGVHMSRFYEAIQTCFSKKKFLTETVQDMLEVVPVHLESNSARVEVGLTYFYPCEAPVSRIEQVLPLNVLVTGIKLHSLDDLILISVRVPYTSLCPCSKEISSQGAHNQRSFAYITVTSEIGDVIYFENLVHIVEDAASASIRPCLKRVDEKEVTEQAYANPIFVEDMVRRLSVSLTKLGRPFMVKVVHEESIHVHNAVAFDWSSDFNFTLFNYLGR